jgi:hypothetical protein
MLVRHRDDNVTALGHAWLSKSVFNASEGITLHFGAETAKIVGRNLNSEVRPNVLLFAAIVRHRVSWIQEADGPTGREAPRTATVIEEIEVS